MEIKGVNIKSMKYDAFNDNEYIEQLRAGGVNVVVGKLDQLINWGRSNSLLPLTFATSCCGIEFMSVGAARYDFARFGFEVARASPRQADVIIVAGTITHKMGACAQAALRSDGRAEVCDRDGGLLHLRRSVQKVLPCGAGRRYDHSGGRLCAGCPPRPESLLYGMMQLQRKVKAQRFFGGANRKEKMPRRVEGNGTGRMATNE